MDEETRQRRQREFTIYLVLFILLVIVGKITTNGQLVDTNLAYRNSYGNPYGSGLYPNYGYDPRTYHQPINMYSNPGYGGGFNGFHPSLYGNGPPPYGGMPVAAPFPDPYFYNGPPMNYYHQEVAHYNYNGYGNGYGNWGNPYPPGPYNMPYGGDPWLGGRQHQGYYANEFFGPPPRYNYSPYPFPEPMHHGWGHPNPYAIQPAYPMNANTWNQPYEAYGRPMNQVWW